MSRPPALIIGFDDVKIPILRIDYDFKIHSK